MEWVSTPLVHESVGKTVAAACQASCPLCNGPLFDFRGSSHCSRCGYTFCAGCEGSTAEQTANDG